VALRWAVAATCAIAALALALASAQPAIAVPREFYGIVPQQSLTGKDIQRMGRGNVGTVRVQLFWPALESGDSFNWAPLDDTIGGLAAEGIRPFANLFGVPSTVSGNHLSLPVGSAHDQREWREFVTEAATRYGPDGTYWQSVYPSQHPGAPPAPIEDWQVWNEQNAPKHTHPKPSPRKYGKLLKSTRSALDKVDPGAEIVLGGMFGFPRGQGAIEAWSFMRSLYKVSGVRSAFDSVAVHPYSPGLRGIKDQLNRTRSVMRRKGDSQAGTWITEIGWGSSGRGHLDKSRSGQAKLLKSSFRLLKRRRGRWNIAGVMWYAWRDLDRASSPCDWCRTAGLFPRNGFNAKPAWRTLTRITGGKP